MSKSEAGLLRKKPAYKIIFSPPDMGKKKTPAKGANRTDDLEAAINSITYTNQASEVIVQTPNRAKEPVRKIYTTNGNQGKIIFTPRSVQKKVFVLGNSSSVPTPVATPKIVKKAPPVYKTITPPTIAPPKKRKLGDFALQSMQVKAPPPKPEPKPEPDTACSLCRLCGSIVEGAPVPITDESGTYSQTGCWMKSIVGSKKNKSGLHPTACCTSCSLKIKLCSSLMHEIQASDEVMSTTYDDLEEGDLVHPTSHVYVCTYCDMEVMGTKEFITHTEKHLVEKSCGPQQSSGNAQATAEENDADAQNIMWNGRIFVEDDIEEDGTTHPPNEDGVHLCEHCNRGFKYLFLLKLHKKSPKRACAPLRACFICKQPSADLKSPEDVCRACVGKQVKIKQTPVKTSRTLEKRYFCDSCSAGFSFKYALRHHFKFHEKMEAKFYINRCCHICMQDLKSAHALRSHLLTEHDIEWKPGGNSYNCQKCLKAFDDLFKLRMHLRLYHNLSLPNGLRTPRGRDYNCQVCTQTFTSESSARKHMRIDHNLTNNDMKSLKTSCEECGKLFAVKQNLLNHINSAHLKIKPMSCDLCDERFVKHSSLIFHKLRHTGEKPFMCTLCKKTYRQRNDVVRHLARHVRDKEVEYESAFAINTSASKQVFKRAIYLKDSTIKGLKDIANFDTAPNKKRKFPKKELPAAVESIQPIEETYQEIVVTDGAALGERDYENAQVQYILAEDVSYVVKSDAEGAGFKYDVIVDNDGQEGAYKFDVADNSEAQEMGYKYDVIVDGTGQQTLKSPEGSCYILRENDAGEQFLVKIDSEEIL